MPRLFTRRSETFPGMPGQLPLPARGRAALLLAGLAGLAGLAATSSGSAQPTAAEPGVAYTWDQAVALGLTKHWQKPPGMPVCPPAKDSDYALPDNASPPADAPECYRPPSSQTITIGVSGPGVPRYLPDLAANPGTD